MSGAEMPMKGCVEQGVEDLAHKDQNFDHLILECCEGSINDAELKAHLEQFGEVIEFDADNSYRAVIMCFKDEKSKIKLKSMEIQCVDGFVRMVQDDPNSIAAIVLSTADHDSKHKIYSNRYQFVSSSLENNTDMCALVNIVCYTLKGIGHRAADQATETLRSKIIPRDVDPQINVHYNPFAVSNS